jgi:hypothetical protein
MGIEHSDVYPRIPLGEPLPSVFQAA